MSASFESTSSSVECKKRGNIFSTAFTHFLMEYNFAIFTSRVHLCERHSLHLAWKWKCTRGKLISTHTLFCRFLYAVMNSKVANLCVCMRALDLCICWGFAMRYDDGTEEQKRLTSHIIKSFSLAHSESSLKWENIKMRRYKSAASGKIMARRC